MDKSEYLAEIIAADKRRLENTKATIERMAESEEREELLAHIDEKIKLNESLA